MNQTTTLAALAAVLVLGGCHSQEAKVADLQKQYDQLSDQFKRDCSADYLKVPPALSPKCEAENKKMKDVWDRLQTERAKE
jgi:hypothetical protein